MNTKLPATLVSYIYTDRDKARQIEKHNGHPRGWPSSYSTLRLYTARMHPHRIALCISDRGSSSDRASIVGGVLQRIFQSSHDEIDHHIPSCTAVVLVEAHAPNHKAAALMHRDQALHLVLKPGRILALPPTSTPTKGSRRTEIAEPSDDLHHIACLSSVRACW